MRPPQSISAGYVTYRPTKIVGEIHRKKGQFSIIYGSLGEEDDDDDDDE